MNTSKPTIFISYASADAAMASSVVAQLERAGLACWMAPRTVALARKPGKQYPSTSRRRGGVLGIDKSCQICQSAKQALKTMI